MVVNALDMAIKNRKLMCPKFRGAAIFDFRLRVDV